MKYQNSPADLSINYKVRTYNQIQELFDVQDGELPSLHFMLSLMGFKHNKKVDLSTKDNSEKSRDFSLRTLYPRYESDMDSYYGLIAILDNLNLNYDEVINDIAFERTGVNGKTFLKMINVKTFYEYMLGGIDYFEEQFMSDGSNPYRVTSNIHEFLIKENQDFDDILIELLTEEEESQ